MESFFFGFIWRKKVGKWARKKRRAYGSGYDCCFSFRRQVKRGGNFMGQPKIGSSLEQLMSSALKQNWAWGAIFMRAAQF